MMLGKLFLASVLVSAPQTISQGEAEIAAIRARYVPELDKAHRGLSAANAEMKEAVVTAEVEVAKARARLDEAKKPRKASPDELGIGRKLQTKLASITSESAEDLRLPK